MENLSLEQFVYLLKQTELVAPYHMEMEHDGYGEFPDSYKLTELGASRLLKELKEKIEEVSKN